MSEQKKEPHGSVAVRTNLKSEMSARSRLLGWLVANQALGSRENLVRQWRLSGVVLQLSRGGPH